MPILWKLFDYVASNKWAQWTLAILSGLFVYKMYERARDMRIRRQVTEKIEAKAEETSREIIQDAKDKTDETAEKVADTRAAIPRGSPSGELPKSTQSTLFDD